MFINLNNIYSKKSNQKVILDDPDILQSNININYTKKIKRFEKIFLFYSD